LSDNLILGEKIDIDNYFNINLDSFVELEIETLSLSSFFQRRYSEFIESFGHDLLKEKLDNIKEEYGREIIKLLILESDREEQIDELVKKNKSFVNLKYINKNLSENLKKLNYKKIYYGRGNLSTEIERNEIIELEESIKQLKFVAHSGAGLENIDINAAENLGIEVLSSPEGNRDAVGEHALGLLLCLLKNICSSYI
jgi:hypothetical protein